MGMSRAGCSRRSRPSARWLVRDRHQAGKSRFASFGMIRLITASILADICVVSIPITLLIMADRSASYSHSHSHRHAASQSFTEGHGV